MSLRENLSDMMNSVERGLITGILAKFLKGCDVVNLTERFVALLCVLKTREAWERARLSASVHSAKVEVKLSELPWLPLLSDL